MGPRGNISLRPQLRASVSLTSFLINIPGDPLFTTVDVLETFSLEPFGLEIFTTLATNSAEPWNEKTH